LSRLFLSLPTGFKKKTHIELLQGLGMAHGINVAEGLLGSFYHG